MAYYISQMDDQTRLRRRNLGLAALLGAVAAAVMVLAMFALAGVL